MKIDFKASYRQLDAIVRAPVRTSEGAADKAPFTKLLSHVSPQGGQIPEYIHENGGGVVLAPHSKTVSQEAKASFDFAEPKFKFGDIARLGPGNVPDLLVKEAPSSVKTPAILDAHIVGEEGTNTSSTGDARASLNPTALKTDPFSPATSMDTVANLVVEAGKRHGIDPSLSMAVVSAESSFNPQAVSSDGHASKGLFQLLDSTGLDLLQRSGVDAKYEPFNPELNSNLGVGYLRYLHDIFSKESSLPNDLKTVAAANSSSLEKLAVAAFNAGEGRVASAQMRAQRGGLDASVYENVEAYLPDNTREYVQKVISAKRDFEGRFIG